MKYKISTKGVSEIAEHEGLVLGAYRDSVGVWTYGIGHTANAGNPDPRATVHNDTRGWRQELVEREIRTILNLFDTDLDSYEARVNAAITVPLKQHEFDALVSFDFNTGGIYRAQLTKSINSGDKSGEGFMGWLRPKEIIGRRKAEQRLFRTGDYAHNGDRVAIYDALGNGKIKFRQEMSLVDMGFPTRTPPPTRRS